MTTISDLTADRDHWEQAAARNGELYAACENQRDQAREERDGAYRERAQLLALLAQHYPAVLAPASVEDTGEDGWEILYLTLPTGQASWHIHPRDLPLFAMVPSVAPDEAAWDGHSTEEKYQRIAQLATRLAVRNGEQP